MLGCAACNRYKHDKPVQNPFAADQRLLNCTEENEFPDHIAEGPDGQWTAKTNEGHYHLNSIGLTADCHRRKRLARRVMADRIYSLLTTAIQYKTHNPKQVHDELMSASNDVLNLLENFPPLVTEHGILTAREWLQKKGLDVGLLSAPLQNIS